MGRTLTGPGNIARSGDTMLGAFNEAKGNDIASTSVVNLVIATGNLVDITGGNTVLSFILASGAERVLRFTGSLRLTNSATLVCPGGSDIITLPGDFATVRGYPGGVVRIVVYTRATGYVQRIGDQLLGNLTLSPGTTISPPLKYQAGVLSTITIPHAHEWNGSNIFATNAAGVRRQLMYTNDDGSAITGLTSLQVTNALGYTPFNAGTTPSTISPPAGLIEIGRYIDFHGSNSGNDYDVRMDCVPSGGGPGTGTLNIGANAILHNGSTMWTQFNLTNLSQLTNGPSYASTNSPTINTATLLYPTVTGQLIIPNGSVSNPGLRFAGAGNDVGFLGIAPGIFAATVGSKNILTYYTAGIQFPAGFNTGHGNNGGEFILQADPSSTMSGDLIVGTTAQRIKFTESSGTNRGAYLDITSCDANGASKILTNKDLSGYSFSGTGYSRDANGLILQWGKKANIGVGAGPITFPIAFPNACFAFFTCYDMVNDRGDYGSGGSASQFGATVHTDGCNTWWMAIGN